MKTAQYPEDKMGTFTKLMLMAALMGGVVWDFLLFSTFLVILKLIILNVNWNFGATHIP